MKKMQYLSPTSLSLFYKDQREFYMKYLAENSPEKEPQTEPMAVGSAFDAFVKAYLHERLFGKDSDPRFNQDAIFETQVQPSRRDQAKIAGAYLFEQYKMCGALTDLMTELSGSITAPRFEFELMGLIGDERSKTVGPVPFLGKPDLFWQNKHGARVVHDWKVNGYYSKYNTSPVAHYVRLRVDGFNKGCHRDALPQIWKGVMINITATLDTVKADWAQQLSIYMWLCGEDVGSQDCIVAIDQWVCNKGSPGVFPQVKLAEHRSRVTKEFQLNVFERAQRAWEIINSDHYFRDVPADVSKQLCDGMDTYYKVDPEAPKTSDDAWFDQHCKPY